MPWDNCVLPTQQPDAPAVKPVGDVIVGQVFSHTSRHLGEEREFRVFLPRSYDIESEARLPVVQVLDGDACFLSAVGAVRALSTVSAMPDAMIVAITSRDRRSDMSAPEMDIRG